MSFGLYVAGIVGIVVLVSIDKFCSTYGYVNAASYLKVALPLAGLAGIGIAVWTLAS